MKKYFISMWVVSLTLLISCASKDNTDLSKAKVSITSQGKKIALSEEQAEEIKAMSWAYLKSSRFNSTGTGAKINFKQDDINAGYKGALSGDHIRIDFPETVQAICHGGMVPVTQLVIGPFNKVTVGAPFTVKETGKIVGYGKYYHFQTTQSKAFRAYVSSVIEP